MDLQDRYDELDNIIHTLNKLISDISMQDYIDQLDEIKAEAQNDLDDIEPQLQEENDAEKKRQLNDYIRDVI